MSLPDCLYVNHPHRIGDAEYKPAGLAAAAEAGFFLPPTHVRGPVRGGQVRDAGTPRGSERARAAGART